MNEERSILNKSNRLARETGIKQGIEQGLQQRNIEIAKSMLNKNMKIEDIMDITGLSKEEINNFK